VLMEVLPLIAGGFRCLRPKDGRDQRKPTVGIYFFSFSPGTGAPTGQRTSTVSLGDIRERP
jgi:hypothetical protein